MMSCAKIPHSKRCTTLQSTQNFELSCTKVDESPVVGAAVKGCRTEIDSSCFHGIFYERMYPAKPWSKGELVLLSTHYPNK